MFLFSPSVFAQTTRSFTISPPTLKFKLNPGQKTEKTIKITNKSSVTMEFVVNVQDFIVTNETGTPELLPEGVNIDNRFSAASWTAVLPDQFIIEPGRSATTTLYLQVPGDARPGGRYFSVTIQPLANPNLETSGTAINTVVGSLVYLTVNGETKEDAKILRFFAPPLSEYGPISIESEIQNTGDIHISPRGTVEVKNLIGKKIYSGVLENLNVFPGTSRLYKNQIESKILLGRFKAKLSGYYGSNNQFPLNAMMTFWVIPYKIIAGIIFGVAIVVIAFTSWKKKQEEGMEVKEEKERKK